MASLIANARMYSVAPAAEAAWRELLTHVGKAAGVPMNYLPWPAPQPLEPLWSRPDLGAVFMCGYPIGLRLAPVQPIAAPIPDADWAGGRAVYRTDFIVRADAQFQTLADTFGHRFGWTVAHSHSGFNAPRRHLLRYRSAARQQLFSEVKGDLITARKIVDSVIDGSIDVGPLDGYWHMLLQRHLPELADKIRIVESTDIAPMPAFAAHADMPRATVGRLQHAFTQAQNAPWFAAVSGPLRLAGFSAASQSDYDLTLAWDAEARAAGYSAPA